MLVALFKIKGPEAVASGPWGFVVDLLWIGLFDGEFGLVSSMESSGLVFFDGEFVVIVVEVDVVEVFGFISLSCFG